MGKIEYTHPTEKNIKKRRIRSPHSMPSEEIYSNMDPHIDTSDAKSLWIPISTQNIINTGGVYTDYTVISMNSPAATGGGEVRYPAGIAGPWYLHKFYCNIYNGWNISQGSGVTITAQENFDYTHVGYFTTTTGLEGNGWNKDNYEPYYTHITGGTHNVFLTYSGMAINDTLTTCYWYSGGTDFSMPGTASGCIMAEKAGDNTLLPNLTIAPANPRTCYNNNFGSTDGLCRAGTYRTPWWTTSGVPSAFAPFSHGDLVISVFGSRPRPINNIDVAGELAGAMGVSPLSTVLIGSNGATYQTQESTFGADIRVNTFSTLMNQATSDLARSYGTVIVQGLGTNVNYDTYVVTGFIPPHNAVQVGNARWLGNSEVMYTGESRPNNTSTNLGAYAGFGRGQMVDFACPAMGVWVNHPRFNIDDYGIWGGTASGNSMAISMGAAMMASVSAIRTGWTWEDITTVLCQSARQYEYRFIPANEAKFGMGKLAGNLLATSTTIQVSQTTFGADSVNWRYALESGNSFSGYHSPYSIIQFGTDPTDDDYELIFYRGITSTDTTITGKASFYLNGTLDNCIRGFMGTIPKAHSTNDIIYTPLLTNSGEWNPCLGFGIPDLARALSIPAKNMSIMPPRNLTTEIISGTVRFTYNPYYSSNLDHVRIVKNQFGYPKSVNDGLTVHHFGVTGHTIVTGYDSAVTTGDCYYAAFQVSENKPVKYSTLTSYCIAYLNSTLSPVKHEERATTLDFSVQPAIHKDGFATSGYRYQLGFGGNFYNTRSNSIRWDALTTGASYIISWWQIPNSINKVWNSAFLTHSGNSEIENWTKFTEIDDLSYSTSVHPSGYYDDWGIAFTSSGSYATSGFGIQVHSSYKIAVTDTNWNKLSYYGTSIYGTGTTYTRVVLLCYSGEDNDTFIDYVGDATPATSGYTGSWQRFEWQYKPHTVTGDNFALPSGTTHIVPKIYGQYNVSDINLNTVLIDNVQWETISGSARQYCGYRWDEAIVSGVSIIMITGG